MAVKPWVAPPPVVETPAPARGFREAIAESLASRRATLDLALMELAASADDLAAVATRLVAALRADNKVLVAGNGGSAAEAQHFAAELVGRFKRERAPYAVLALTTDTAILTAVGNDYGYAEVFARQVLAFGQPGDVLLTFSTSGESDNLLRAASAGRQRGMAVIALTGVRSSSLERAADLTLRMPAVDTAVVQELHKIVTHVLCDLVELDLMAWAEAGAR